MKYLKSLLVLPFLVALNVYAADECTYKEQANLNKLAAQIKANYEVIKKEEPFTFVDPDTLEEEEMTITVPTFEIKIYNISESLSLSITESFEGKTGDSKTVTYNDTENGVYTFTSDNAKDIINYAIKVNAFGGGCGGKTIRNLSLTKPKSNPYFDYEICKGHEDIDYCQEFTTKNYDISFDDLTKKIEEVEIDPIPVDPDKENKFLKFLKANYIYIIIGTVVVAGGVGVYFIYRKKRVL